MKIKIKPTCREYAWYSAYKEKEFEVQPWRAGVDGEMILTAEETEKVNQQEGYDSDFHLVLEPDFEIIEE